MTPLQVLDRYLDALLAGDLDAIRTSFAEDAAWTLHGDLPISGPWQGRDAIVDDFLVKVGGELFAPGTQRFDWLTRHWFRKRAAFTRPNFGTAISMSNTFAVETYSGGSSRISSIWTLPFLRSFFSCARRTRMSLALARASMR